jgi:hypothetical protein
MSAEWYVKLGQREQGPFSIERLQQFAKDGKIPSIALIRNGQEGAWTQVTEFKALFASGTDGQESVPDATDRAESEASELQPGTRLPDAALSEALDEVLGVDTAEGMLQQGHAQQQRALPASTLSEWAELHQRIAAAESKPEPAQQSARLAPRRTTALRKSPAWQDVSESKFGSRSGDYAALRRWATVLWVLGISSCGLGGLVFLLSLRSEVARNYGVWMYGVVIVAGGIQLILVSVVLDVLRDLAVAARKQLLWVERSTLALEALSAELESGGPNRPE